MDQSDLCYLTMESSRDTITGEVDPGLIAPKMLIVRQDSGIQIVYGDIEHCTARADRFKEPFRSLAIRMSLADKKGLYSISSERGAYMKEFNMSRSVVVGQNEGDTYTDADQFFHENVLGKKGFFKHNKKSTKSSIEI
jgi:hypothetical protein